MHVYENSIPLYCNINVLQFVGSGNSCKNRGVVLLLESCHGLTLRSSLFKLVLHVHSHLMASCVILLATGYCWAYTMKYKRMSYKPVVSRYERQKNSLAFHIYSISISFTSFWQLRGLQPHQMFKIYCTCAIHCNDSMSMLDHSDVTKS